MSCCGCESGENNLDLKGEKGERGYASWNPIYANVVDGDRVVQRIIGYVGGEGTQPPYLNYYLSNGIPVTDISLATDIKGSKGDTGNNGTNGLNGWTAVTANVPNGDLIVQQVIDYTGGTGTKPQTGLYIGSLGLTADINQATNIRGLQGLQGDAGADGQDVTDGRVKITSTGTLGYLSDKVDVDNAVVKAVAGDKLIIGLANSTNRYEKITGGATAFSVQQQTIILSSHTTGSAGENRFWEINAVVNITGNQLNPSEVNVRLFIDGVVVASDRMSIAANGLVSASFHYSFSKTGTFNLGLDAVRIGSTNPDQIESYLISAIGYLTSITAVKITEY